MFVKSPATWSFRKGKKEVLSFKKNLILKSIIYYIGTDVKFTYSM